MHMVAADHRAPLGDVVFPVGLQGPAQGQNAKDKFTDNIGKLI